MSASRPRSGDVTRSVGYTIGEADIALFAAVSTDFSRLHTDAAYAAVGQFGRRVGHGLLGMCLAEGLLGRRRAAIAFAWEWEFSAPFFIGDTLSAEATVEAVDEGRRGYVATEGVVVANQAGTVVQRGRHRLAHPGAAAPPAWLPEALAGPAAAFEDLSVADQGPVPPSSTPIGRMAETGVFFEDLNVGDGFRTPGYTVSEFQASAFAGLTGEAGPWFHADARGMAGRPLAPLYGLALVEGLKYCLAPDGGVGIPMASLGWRWRQVAPFHPGDTLHLEVTVQGKRASRSKADRGVVAQAISLVAESRGVVQHGQHLQMFRRRPRRM